MSYSRADCKSDCDAVAFIFSATVKKAHPETNMQCTFTSFSIPEQSTIERSYCKAEWKADCDAVAFIFSATFKKAHPETNMQCTFTSFSIPEQSTVERSYCKAEWKADCDAVAFIFSATVKKAHPETNKHFINSFFKFSVTFHSTFHGFFRTNSDSITTSSVSSLLYSNRHFIYGSFSHTIFYSIVCSDLYTNCGPC
jgi:hypothetical protein